jgi:hypothetical protein
MDDLAARLEQRWTMAQHTAEGDRRRVRQGQRAGRIRCDVRPDTLALMFLGLIQLTAFLWHISGGELDVATHSDEAWQVFSQAIASR